MAKYEIVFHDGYGREIDSMEVTAPSMEVALTLSANLLTTGAVRDGQRAESAAVERVGVYDQEQHSVRAELHEAVAAAAYDPRDQDEFGTGLGEINATEEG